jgi:hypothetical protein
VAERQRSFPGSPFFGTVFCWEERFRRRRKAGLRVSRRCRQRDLAFQGGAETLVRAGPSMLEGSFGQLLPVRSSFRRTGARGRSESLRAGPSSLVKRAASGVQGSSGLCGPGPERDDPFRPAGPRQGAASGTRTVFRHRRWVSPGKPGFGNLPQGFRAAWTNVRRQGSTVRVRHLLRERSDALDRSVRGALPG